MAKFKVALRGGFSDRNKIKQENTTIQTNALDERTRVALCNATNIIISKGLFHGEGIYNKKAQKFIKHVYADVYGQIVSWDSSYSGDSVLTTLLETIMEADYDDVLTVIEYIARNVDELTPIGFLYEGCTYLAEILYNQVFEREYVGYRFVNGYITPITDSAEISTIEDAMSAKYDAVREHIDKALHLLSDRDLPDYANSIKESISAVERMCSIIVGKSTTLNDALNKLQSKGVAINAQMKVAFEKLYNYTNGASGIRHAGQLDGPEATFEEAKFMLVSCCAFVNYLTGLLAKCP